MNFMMPVILSEMTQHFGLYDVAQYDTYTCPGVIIHSVSSYILFWKWMLL